MNTAPPSISLARICMHLASTRAYGINWDGLEGWVNPVDRQTAYCHADLFPAAYHYYVICDRITRGERP